MKTEGIWDYRTLTDRQTDIPCCSHTHSHAPDGNKERRVLSTGGTRPRTYAMRVTDQADDHRFVQTTWPGGGVGGGGGGGGDTTLDGSCSPVARYAVSTL